jgi:hypothetical protein
VQRHFSLLSLRMTREKVTINIVVREIMGVPVVLS